MPFLELFQTRHDTVKAVLVIVFALIVGYWIWDPFHRSSLAIYLVRNAILLAEGSVVILIDVRVNRTLAWVAAW
jgi:cytochrome b subunit of formate dehydrogenase